MRINAEFLHQLKTYFLPRTGSSTLGGNITPGETDVYNLGSSNKRWGTIYAQNVVADSLVGSGEEGDFVPIAIAVTITARHTFSPSTAASPFILGANAQGQTVTGLRADQLNKSISAGTGLTGGGLLTANQTLDINYGGGAGSMVAVQTAGTGSSQYPARADHVHSISTGVAVSLSAATVNAEGSATSLARSDHTHDLLTATAVDLDVSSESDEGVSTSLARADHTHDIITSSNPGAAAAILQSSVAGELFLTGDFGVDADTLYVDVSEDSVYINSSTLPAVRGALTVSPANVSQKGFVLKKITGLTARLFAVYDENDSDLLIITNEGDLESGNPGFVSGLTGWQITHDGNAEFWNVFVRGELHATIFVADELHATGGTLAVLTASRVVEPVDGNDNVLGALDAQFDLLMEASWDTGFSYFAVDDVIRLKFMGDSGGGGLDIWDIYVEVDAVSSVIDRDLTQGNPGYFNYTVTRRSGGSTGIEIPPGVAGVKWGEVSGSGYSGALLLTADLNQSPYMDVFTIDNSVTYDPWEALAVRPRVRVGNLDGLPNQSEQWGIAFGTDLSDDTMPYGIFSDIKAELHGITQSWWDASGNVVGEVDPTAVSSQSLFWLGNSASDKLFEFTKGGVLGLSGSVVMSRRPDGKHFTGGLFWLSFDGGTNLTTSSLFESVDRVNWVSPNNLVAIAPFRGKYNKGAHLGSASSNEVDNPGFNNNITDGWSSILNGGIIERVTNVRWIGAGGAKITAGTGSTFLRSISTIAVVTGNTIWGQAVVYCPTETARANARVRFVDATTNVLLGSASAIPTKVGEYELVVISYTHSGVTSSAKIELRNQAADSASEVYFDAVQMELNTLTPFIWPPYSSDMSWSGTAHNSNSDRDLDSKLNYTLSMPAAWTISLWHKPIKLPTDDFGSTFNRLIDWNGDTNNYFRLYYSTSADKLTIAWTGNGTSVTATDSTTIWVRGDWFHIMVAYSGGTATLYVNGVQVAQMTGLTAMTTTPTALYLGTNSGFSNLLDGAIDDLFILSTSLVAEDAVELYNATQGAVVSDTLEIFLNELGEGRLSLRPQGIFAQNSVGSPTLALLNSAANADWGGFTLGTGDLVIGNNVSGSAAIWWDKSAGIFGFYGDGVGTPQVTINTDGSVRAGGGNVILDAAGITIISPDAEDQINEIKWLDGAVTEGAIGTYGSGVMYLYPRTDFIVALTGVSGTFTMDDADAIFSMHVRAFKISTDPSNNLKWELGGFTSGGDAVSNGYVTVTIDGTQRKLMTRA